MAASLRTLFNLSLKCSRRIFLCHFRSNQAIIRESQTPEFRHDLVLIRCRHHSSKQHAVSRPKPTTSDPRKSVRYPYVLGDPVQDSAIKETLNKSSSSSYYSQVKENIGIKSARSNENKDNVVTETTSTSLHNHKPIIGNQEKKVKKIKNLKNVFQTKSGLVYEKLHEGDIRLGRTLLDAKVKQPGSTSSNILLEGVRLIRDALQLGAEGWSLYFTDVSILDQLPMEHLTKLNLYKILYRDMKTWSDTTTPSGLLGVFKRPDQGEAVATQESSLSLPLTIILDSLKDPGNIGTLIRTAAAVGCKQILSVRGTVNLWDGKVLRSAMGGHFCVPLYWGLHWSDVHNYVNSDSSTKVLLADTRSGKSLSRAFDSEVNLEHLQSNDPDESDSDSETDETATEWKQTSMDRRSEEAAYNFHKVPMSILDYTQLELSSDPGAGLPNVAIVLGGETEGLSAQAKKFAFDHYGHYVTIPMNPAVNSLNTGVAGSILLYEIRRQLMKLEGNEMST